MVEEEKQLRFPANKVMTDTRMLTGDDQPAKHVRGEEREKEETKELMAVPPTANCHAPGHRPSGVLGFRKTWSKQNRDVPLRDSSTMTW